MVAGPMTCPDPRVLEDLSAGRLDAETRHVISSHVAQCARCRAAGSMRRNADVTLGDTVATGNVAIPNVDPLAVTGGVDPLAATGAVTTSAVVRSRGNLVGRSLGRYAIVDRLGAGAMGVVYRAEDAELGRSVAIKLLHRPEPTLTERLVREARAMAKVTHPNVVAVYDVGTQAGATYIAMELVGGDSLRAWQQRRTIHDIVQAYVAAGRGLSAAHDAGIVQRDFKPDNVLVGSDGRVRVTDFGLAASPIDARTPSSTASASMSDVNLTTSGSVMGTPAYMAPEQFEGGNVDARTDQFNFCASLYEALYGERPFEGATFPELHDNVVNGRIRTAPSNSRVPKALRSIVVRGLAVRPGDRHPSMALLLRELARDRARPWRRAALACAVVGVALGVGLAVDHLLRDRVTDEIRVAFEATGRQTARAFDRLADRLEASANQVYLLQPLRAVSGNRDQADFGLGTTEDDAKNLARLHDELASMTWDHARDVVGAQYAPVFAVADYKNRLMFTSAAPSHWGPDLTPLAWVRAAAAGSGRSLVLVPPSDPTLKSTGLLGTTTSDLVFAFARALILNGEAQSQLVQIVDAGRLLEDIRLDDETRLAIVAPDGRSVGDVPRAMLDAVRGSKTSHAVDELEVDDRVFQLQTRPLARQRGDILEPAIGHVVMARALPRGLSLFPHARVVFASALALAVVLALWFALAARRITLARVET